MPKIDLSTMPLKTGSIYPAPYDGEMAGRSSIRVGRGGGLTQFGANIVILEPGAKSSLRHWHEKEDEFVMIMDGVCTLVDESGAQDMHPGECATFPAGDANGHHFINESAEVAKFLVIGTSNPSEKAHYSDVDLVVEIKDGAPVFTHRDGSAYQQNT